MSSSVISGQAYIKQIEFTMLGELVTPTSASYSVYDNAGNIVSALSDVVIAIPSGATSATITIPGTANVKSLEVSIRSVRVKYIVNTIEINKSFFYTIEDSVLIPVDYKSVRDLAGIPEDLLSDEQIDLLSAYKTVEYDSQLDLSTIISAGGTIVLDLIRAIACKAAINSIMSLQSTFFKKEQADNTSYERFEDFNLNDKLKDLSSLYSTYLSRLTGTASATLTYSRLAFGTDAVTGA